MRILTTLCHFDEKRRAKLAKKDKGMSNETFDILTNYLDEEAKKPLKTTKNLKS